jgi:O-Antigen ligase
MPERVRTATWIALLAPTAGLALVLLADRLTLAGIWPPLPPLGPGGPPSPRISEPLGYWNAVGLWCGVTCIVHLLAAAHLDRRSVRRIAGAVIPLVLAAGYLTYSRGAILTAILGLTTALALAPRRRAALLLLGAVLAPAAAAIGVVAADTGVAFGTAVARPWTLLALGVAAGAGALLADRSASPALAARTISAQQRIGRAIDARVGRRRALALGGIMIAVLVGGQAQSVARSFDAPYRPVTDVRSRYGDMSSGGRTLLWRAAWDAWRAHPGGTGADTFRLSFDHVAPLGFTARDAHSVYLERLSERGLLGLGSFLAAMAIGAAALAASWRAARGDARSGGLVAAAAGGLAAIMGGAALDWYWEIDGVRALAFVLLAAGLMPLALRGRQLALPALVSRGLAFPAVVSLALAAMQFAPDREARAIAASQAAVRAGDLTAARRAADRAIALEPHRTTGLVQRALISELAGRPAAAVDDLRAAFRRTPGDWRIAALLARANAETGKLESALGAMRTGRRARPAGQFFSIWVGPAVTPGFPRPCTGTVQLEREHCERLPRADGSWELPGEPRAAARAPLPNGLDRAIQAARMSDSWSRRLEATALLRLVEARPAPRAR